MTERIRVDWLKGIRKVVGENTEGEGPHNLYTLFQQLQFHVAQLDAHLLVQLVRLELLKMVKLCVCLSPSKAMG